MILAGDIGGTKTHLALFDWTTERVDPLRLETFHSADYASLEDMLEEFLAPPKPPTTQKAVWWPWRSSPPSARRLTT